MTFRFRHFDYTTDDVGKKLVCVSTQTDYFTVGKTYPILQDGNHMCIRTDHGDILHSSSSEFEFYYKQATERKLPKVGEVWAHTSHYQNCPNDDDYDPDQLYYIIGVEGDRVINRCCSDCDDGTYTDNMEYFLRAHTFVF